MNDELDVVLPKGAEVKINGVPVKFRENLHFEIVGAVNRDQIAEQCAAAGIPVDMGQFAHVADGCQVAYSPTTGEKMATPVSDDDNAPQPPVVPVPGSTEPMPDPPAPAPEPPVVPVPGSTEPMPDGDDDGGALPPAAPPDPAEPDPPTNAGPKPHTPPAVPVPGSTEPMEKKASGKKEK